MHSNRLAVPPVLWLVLFTTLYMVDFSKAFDTVDHVIFIRKLQALNIQHTIG